MEAFEDQVSGQNNVVCLTKGTLAKPLNQHENKFYQTMDETLIPFVPKYKGTINVDSIEDEKSNNLYSKDTILEENESYHNSQEYLLLENLKVKYRLPYVLEIKIGARQYLEDGTEANRSKVHTTPFTSGLRIHNMQVHKSFGLWSF